MTKKSDSNIIDTYIRLLTELHKVPSLVDLRREGISRAKVRAAFISLEGLRTVAEEEYPQKFLNIIDKDIISKRNIEELEDELAQHNRFVVTTAVAGCDADVKLLKSIKTYCDINNAKHLVLVTGNPKLNKNQHGNASMWIDNRIQDYGGCIIGADTKLNNSVFLSLIKLSAKQINPLTGLKRIGQREGSFIYASPKQCLESIATNSAKIPKVMLTPGACTLPIYSTDSFMAKRTSYIAEVDHVMGGLVVEIRDKKLYHFRHFQSDKSGGFADLGKYYSSKGVKSYIPSALIWGDYHAGSICKDTRQGNLDLMINTKCKKAIIHDLFDGTSINPHEMKQNMLKAKRHTAKGIVTLEAEFKHIAQEMEHLLDSGAKELIIVESNHHDFLRRWLEDGTYAKDALNLTTAIKVANAYIDGHNPIKAGVEVVGGLKNKYKKKITWLDRDTSYKIAQVECGSHGDKGANGSRASFNSLENAFGSCIVGHAHTPRIQRGVYIVGTTTKLKLDYNVGPSGWMNASCLIYPNGSRQMLIFINGKYCLDME